MSSANKNPRPQSQLDKLIEKRLRHYPTISVYNKTNKQRNSFDAKKALENLAKIQKEKIQYQADFPRHLREDNKRGQVSDNKNNENFYYFLTQIFFPALINQYKKDFAPIYRFLKFIQSQIVHGFLAVVKNFHFFFTEYKRNITSLYQDFLKWQEKREMERIQIQQEIAHQVIEPEEKEEKIEILQISKAVEMKTEEIEIQLKRIRERIQQEKIKELTSFIKKNWEYLNKLERTIKIKLVSFFKDTLSFLSGSLLGIQILGREIIGSSFKSIFKILKSSKRGLLSPFIAIQNSISLLNREWARRKRLLKHQISEFFAQKTPLISHPKEEVVLKVEHKHKINYQRKISQLFSFSIQFFLEIAFPRIPISASLVIIPLTLFAIFHVVFSTQTLKRLTPQEKDLSLWPQWQSSYIQVANFYREKSDLKNTNLWLEKAQDKNLLGQRNEELESLKKALKFQMEYEKNLNKSKEVLLQADKDYPLSWQIKYILLQVNGILKQNDLDANLRQELVWLYPEKFREE